MPYNALDFPSSVKPFAMPSAAVLQASPRKAFVHLMSVTTHRRAHAQASPDDQWAFFNDPDNTYENFHQFGGYSRQRALPRNPDVALTTPSSQWLVEDIKWELEALRQSGWDGMQVDIQAGWYNASTPEHQYNWAYNRYLAQATNEFGQGMKVIWNPDGTETAAVRAESLRQLMVLSGQGNYDIGDGRYLMTAYAPGCGTCNDAHWQQILATLDTAGYPIAFMPTVQPTGDLDHFAPYSWGGGQWGQANPPVVSSGINSVNVIHSKIGVDGVGLKHQQWIRPQDWRPTVKIGWEAKNTQLLRNSFQIAIDGGSDFIQGVTWNDHRETSMLRPSSSHGFNLLDICAYYLVWWKLGTPPTITTDAVYLSHRIHPHAAAWTSTGQIYTANAQSGVPWQDTVEALVFLTATADVKITTGGVTSTVTKAPGLQVFSVPLGLGTVSAEIVRSGVTMASVTSPWPVTNTPYVQDRTYRMVGSLNEGFTAMADGAVTIKDSAGVDRAVDAQTIGSEFQQTINIGNGVDAGRIAGVEANGNLFVGGLLSQSTYTSTASDTLTTELNSLAAAAYCAASAAIDNTSGRTLYHDLELTVQFAVAPVVNTLIEVYVVPSLDGTNYTDGGGAVAPAPNLYYGAFLVRAVTTAQRMFLQATRPLPVGAFKYVLRNGTAQAFPASGSVMRRRPWKNQLG